jgi:hypothetical protein
MNFFGHAAIAGRFRATPEFVLGAMLPDFSGMLGLKTPPVTPDALGAGVRFHHLTDHAFHELRSFRAFCAESTRWLDAQNVRRGTARAVAHVGVELLLDAALAEGETARARYFAALGAARQGELFAPCLYNPEECARLAGLAEVLEDRGISRNPDTALVITRLERALAARPRLAIEPRDQAAIGAWVELFRDRVVASAPDLVSELTSTLEPKLAA